METSLIVSIIAVLFTGIGLILNTRKDTRTDAAKDAIVQTKLDNLITGVNDIRVEIRSMRDSINNHSERLVKIEEMAQNNSRRIDVLEQKGA